MGQKTKLIGKKIVYSVIAVVLFGLIFLFTYGGVKAEQQKISAPIVMMGDSILGNCRDESSVTALMSEMLGESVVNGALGGTGMALLEQGGRLANTSEILSMYALSKAIVSGDFGPQQTVRSREAGTEYFEQAINELESVDFASVEILFLEHALNDYHSGVPIYNEENPYDPYSFTGAMRSVIELLQEKYPDMRIILVTPTYTWYRNYWQDRLTCENYDLGGGLLEDYVNAEIALAESMGVEIIDLYHDFYPCEQWDDSERYTFDGVHPNDAGRVLIAKKLYEYLQSN